MGIKCTLCGQRLIAEDRVISKKMLGFDTDRFYCVKCLAIHLECEEEALNAKLEQLKEEGCRCFDEEFAYILEAGMR